MTKAADKPTEGPFPVIRYTFDPEQRLHLLTCCKGTVKLATTDEGAARWFVASHTAEHARNRIVTPEPPEPK